MPSQEFLNRRGSIWERTDFAGRPFPELRREMDARVMEELKIPEGVEVHEGTVAGVPGRWANTNRGTGRFLLYIHGGGFTLGSSGVALPYVTELARRGQKYDLFFFFISGASTQEYSGFGARA